MAGRWRILWPENLVGRHGQQVFPLGQFRLEIPPELRSFVVHARQQPRLVSLQQFFGAGQYPPLLGRVSYACTDERCRLPGDPLEGVG